METRPFGKTGESFPILSLVRPEKMQWKATDWNDPREWVPRGRGL